MQRQKAQKRASHLNYFVKRSKILSEDLRWRIISLTRNCGVDLSFISELFVPTTHSVQTWCKRFLITSSARDDEASIRKFRRSDHVVRNVEAHVKAHPTF